MKDLSPEARDFLNRHRDAEARPREVARERMRAQVLARAATLPSVGPRRVWPFIVGAAVLVALGGFLVARPARVPVIDEPARAVSSPPALPTPPEPALASPAPNVQLKPLKAARPPGATPPAVSRPAPNAPEATDLADLELLHRVDREIRAGRWEAALVLLDGAGPALREGGQYAQESWALRALAQCTGGLTAEGLVSAAHVERGSTYEERLRSVCAP